MVTIPTGEPTRRSALARSRASRPSSAPPSPPGTEYFDILSPPGIMIVTSHRDRLSSRDAKIDAGAGRVVVGWEGSPVLDIGRLARCVVRHLQFGRADRRLPP